MAVSFNDAAVLPKLPDLPEEILVKIVKSSYHSYDDEHLVNIDGFAKHFPATFPIVRVNQKISRSVLSWAYGTRIFAFASESDEIYFGSFVPRYAAEGLLWWLQGIGAVNRQSIRQLRLALTVPELLLMFATEETRALLKLPRNLHVWAECLATLKELQLNTLEVMIFSELDDRLSYKNDWKKSLQPDYRWAIKAVTETYVHLPNCKIHFVAETGCIEQITIDSIRNYTWNMLHSTTCGYRRCGKLAYPNKRATSWLSPEDEVVKPYQIPMIAPYATDGEEVCDSLLPPCDELFLL